MSGEAKVGFLALGAALLIPGIVALWRAASLRGDLSQRWIDRVDLVLTGLSEKAADELLQIQLMASDVVGSPGARDPLQIVGDPSALRSRLKRFVAMLRARDRVKPRLALLLRIGPAFLLIVPFYLAGILLAFSYLGELHSVRWAAVAAKYVILAALALMILLFIAYAYLQHQLSKAETLVKEAS